MAWDWGEEETVARDGTDKLKDEPQQARYFRL